MIYRWTLPDLGEGIHEAEVVRWLVSEGAQVAVDQPIAEVQTDKALVEIPSPVGGRVLRLLAAPGQIVRVGTVLVEFETEPDAGNAQPTAEPQATARAPLASSAVVEGGTGTSGSETPMRRPLAAPAVRRRARELGVDLTAVRGSGRGGRVTMRDVEAAARLRDTAAQAPPTVTNLAPAPAPPLEQAPEDEAERVPLVGLRRVIAQRMVQSKFTAPHVTGMDEADVTELVAVRQRMEPEAQARGVKLTFLPFIIRAVVSGLKRFPYLNASIDTERGEILLKRRYHIGIAVDTPEGLMVPVIRDADRKSLLELAEEVARLSEQARSRTISLQDLQGSTFTISNIGSFGGTFATPIINPPEVAILATGRIVRRPMYGPGDQIVPRWLMAVSLTFDHRVIDGGYSARFMRHVIERLEVPERLFLEL